MNNQTEENKPTKTILIFGVSSFVGSNLAEFFKNEYRVVGTYFKNPVHIPGVLCLPCDVLSKDEVQLVLFATKPDITIYSVGISSLYECSKREEMADALNTSGLFNVAEYCQRYKSQICYISSGFVFGGENKKYIEMDIPDANTVYGKTQAAAEFYIQKTSLNYVIFRCCKLFGRSISPIKASWFENLQRKFKTNQPVPCDDYVATGFLDVFYLAMILKICFDKGVINRLFQLTSQDTMTVYQFTKEYARVYLENENLISRSRWPFPSLSGQGTLSKLNYDLDISNIESFLNVKMPTIKEAIEFSFKRFQGDEKSAQKNKKGEGVSFI